MASIQKRKKKDGTMTYRVEVRMKGHPAERATFTRLTDAKKWAQDTESAIRDGRFFKTREAQKHTVADMVDRYIMYENPKRNDQADRKRKLEYWKKEIGTLSLAEATPAKIAEVRDKLLSEPMPRPERKKKLSSPDARKWSPTPRGEKRQPATVARYMAAISHAFTVAVNEWGWIEDSPMRKVSKPKEPRGRVRFLSEDETINGKIVEGERTRLLKACEQSNNDYLYLVVVMALSTGMRQGEIMNLKWSDVDLKQARITLLKTKNGEIRVVPIAGKALALLKEHAKARNTDTDLLFPGKPKYEQDRKPIYKPQNLRSSWLTALKKAKVENFRFHDLRHSAASYLTMNGASLAEVAEILGQKTLQMVKRYSHLSEAHTSSVVAALNERMFGGSQ